jgi:HNH endonuclease
MNPRYPHVARRAAHRCEYCHAPEVVFNFPFEVDHIQPQAEAGTSEEDNLALACRSCNIYKSAYLTGFDEMTESTVRLFHPRRDVWEDHFEVLSDRGMFQGRTDIGRATIMRLRMNRGVQWGARIFWMRLGVFP